MDCVEMESLLLNEWLIKSLVWQIFSLVFDAIDSEKCLLSWHVKLAKYVMLAVYRYDKAQYWATHLNSVYCAS